MPQARAPVSPCPLRPAGHRWLFARDRSTVSEQADVCGACGMVRLTSFRTGQPRYEVAVGRRAVPESRRDRDRRLQEDRASEGTARRLTEARLRAEIARREAADPSDPRIKEARRELRALAGMVRRTG